MRLINADELKKTLTKLHWTIEDGFVKRPYLDNLIDDIPTVEQPQDNLNKDEKRLIGVAVEYLLGAELLGENGWSENDIKVLQSLYERYYVEDSEEEE